MQLKQHTMKTNAREEQSAADEAATQTAAPLDLIEFLRRLSTEGKQVEATSASIDITQQPAYFDLKRFKRAQTTCQEYFTNISLASTVGLLILLQVESILLPLLKTGKSRTVADLYDRYTATGKYVRKYYESDFFEPTNDGFKYINLVRSMHQRIHKLMMDERQSSDSLDGAELPVNQHDMAITQFAFIGLFLLRPDKCAAYSISERELSDIAYYWRLISYYLGIEERFNLFAYHDDIDKQIKLMQLMLDHLNNLRAANRFTGLAVRMSEGVMLAFEDLSTESSFNILDHWWWPFVSLSGRRNQLKPYTWLDLWKLVFFLFYFKILFRSKLITSWMNSMYKRKFDKFCASSEKIKPKLAKKYANIIYEMP